MHGVAMTPEPPDPLRHSFAMNLYLTPAQWEEMTALEAALEESHATGKHLNQQRAEEAVDDFWRARAAEQVAGAAEELTAWRAWRAAGGGRQQVRVVLGADLGTVAEPEPPEDPADYWKRP